MPDRFDPNPEYESAELARVLAEEPEHDEPEFGPISRAPVIDDGLDFYEGRHLAYLESEERRSSLSGFSPEERVNVGAGWYA